MKVLNNYFQSFTIIHPAKRKSVFLQTGVITEIDNSFRTLPAFQRLEKAGHIVAHGKIEEPKNTLPSQVVKDLNKFGIQFNQDTTEEALLPQLRAKKAEYENLSLEYIELFEGKKPNPRLSLDSLKKAVDSKKEK